MLNWPNIGIKESDFERYVQDQIFSLPGIQKHAELLSVAITGSRAVGKHTPKSDVDIEVVCPAPAYEALQHAAFEAGIIKSPDSFGLVTAPADGWERYFGPQVSRSHFSVLSLSDVERQIRDYEDVWLWIWTNAAIVRDPTNQLRQLLDSFDGYPSDVLVRKIKYRWLLAGYWSVNVTPFHTHTKENMAAAAAAILNTVHELLRLFFLVEGRPYPYTQKLMQYAESTPLGREFLPLFQRVVELTLGEREPRREFWERMDEPFALLNMSDSSPECRRLEAACAQKMMAAGVPREWVQADYKNVDDLLLGRLGPIPN